MYERSVCAFSLLVIGVKPTVSDVPPGCAVLSVRKCKTPTGTYFRPPLIRTRCHFSMFINSFPFMFINFFPFSALPTNTCSTFQPLLLPRALRLPLRLVQTHCGDRSTTPFSCESFCCRNVVIRLRGFLILFSCSRATLPRWCALEHWRVSMRWSTACEKRCVCLTQYQYQHIEVACLRSRLFFAVFGSGCRDRTVPVRG